AVRSQIVRPLANPSGQIGRDLLDSRQPIAGMSRPRSPPFGAGRLATGCFHSRDPRRMQGPELQVPRRPAPAGADPTREGSQMKSTYAALALCGALAAGPAWAQAPYRG